MQYLLSVFGPAKMSEFGNYPDEETMVKAMADTGAFNEPGVQGVHRRLLDHRGG